MGERLHSLLHWDEIHKKSKNLERKANRLLQGMGFYENYKGKLKRRKTRWQKRREKKKQWIQPKYAVYMNSKAWFKRREEFLAKYGEYCAICGESKNIHVHHISYRHVGRELDEELVVLCKNHHDEYHEKYGVKLDNTETNDFIIEKQEEVGMDEIIKRCG